MLSSMTMAKSLLLLSILSIFRSSAAAFSHGEAVQPVGAATTDPPVSQLGGAASFASSEFDDDAASKAASTWNSPLQPTLPQGKNIGGAGSGVPLGAAGAVAADLLSRDSSVASLEAEKSWELQQQQPALRKQR